jgi:hypothetical protein
MPKAQIIFDQEWIIRDKMLNEKGLELVEF